MPDQRLAELLQKAPIKQRPLLTGNSSIYDIINERFANPGNQPAQDALSIPDHQAFARQVMEDAQGWRKPVNALGLAVAIPGYEALKALGLTNKDQYTSRPSLASILAGYKGLGQGIARSF